MNLGFEINKVHNVDAYEAIKQIPDKSVDLIVTDPPYEFHSGVDFSGMFKNRTKLAHKEIVEAEIVDGIDNAILDEFVRVMKNINIYIWCNKEQIKGYLNYFLEIDSVKISFEILTWHKSNPTPLTSNTYLPDTEYLLFFREKGAVKLNDGYELKSKYFISQTNKSDKDLFKHPTIKPLGFTKKLILHSSNEGDIILDPFSGSGTTAVACKETNRNFIGFEIEKKWCDIANDRIDGINSHGQTSIFTFLENDNT